jgi:prepilin-type N-terminal cleavage/methylation domain-containing protein
MKRGFTLIELIVLLVLLGIIAAIAIPTYLKSRLSATGADSVGDVRAVESSRYGEGVNSPKNFSIVNVNDADQVASIDDSVSAEPTIKAEAEHYVSEYSFSTIGITLIPTAAADQTLQEVSMLLPDPFTLPYAEDVNINLEGSEGWTCSTESDSTPPRVTCTGPTGMSEGEKSVFTLFFKVKFTDIPSGIHVTIPITGGKIDLSVPLAQNQ